MVQFMAGDLSAANYSRMSNYEKAVAGSLFLAVAYPVWARGGTFVDWQGPLIWLSLLAFAVLLFFPDPRQTLRSRVAALARDPLLYVGIIFLALLVLQAENSGRIRIWDTKMWGWRYSDPPKPTWPSAVTRAEAMEMIRWFLPAGIIALSLRHAFFSSHGYRVFLGAVVGNAAVNAAWGLVQFVSGMDKMYGFHALPGFFFSSFGYPNHAASFYMLTLAAGFGLLIAACRRQGRVNRMGTWLLLGSVITLLIASNLTLSRAGILGSWGLTVFAGILFFSRSWHRLSPSQRFNIFLVLIAVVAVSFFLVSGLGHGLLDAELQKIRDRPAEKDFAARWFQARAAWEMFLDYPWFGVGGWGYRYFMAMYLPSDQWDLVGVGKANVHNDPIQFLAEFGIVGFACLTAAGLLMIMGAVRYMKKADTEINEFIFRPTSLIILAGLFLLLLQSLLDLPFRSPAVLYTWIVVMGCLAPAADDASAYSPDSDF